MYFNCKNYKKGKCLDDGEKCDSKCGNYEPNYKKVTKSSLRQTKGIGFKILILTYLILLALDVYSTLANGELVKYLEANPLYPYIGVWGIVGINIFLLTICYLIYNNSKHHSRFYIISSLVIVSFVRIKAIINNFYWVNNPVSVEVAKRIATPVVKKATLLALLIPGIELIIIIWFIYFIFSFDHEITRK